MQNDPSSWPERRCARRFLRASAQSRRGVSRRVRAPVPPSALRVRRAMGGRVLTARRPPYHAPARHAWRHRSPRPAAHAAPRTTTVPRKSAEILSHRAGAQCVRASHGFARRCQGAADSGAKRHFRNSKSRRAGPRVSCLRCSAAAAISSIRLRVAGSNGAEERRDLGIALDGDRARPSDDCRAVRGANWRGVPRRVRGDRGVGRQVRDLRLAAQLPDARRDAARVQSGRRWHARAPRRPAPARGCAAPRAYWRSHRRATACAIASARLSSRMAVAPWSPWADRVAGADPPYAGRTGRAGVAARHAAVWLEIVIVHRPLRFDRAARRQPADAPLIGANARTMPRA